MEKQGRKSLRALLYAAMTVILLLVLPGPAGADGIIDSGTCGEHLTWTLNSDYTLSISGTGPMDDYFGRETLKHLTIHGYYGSTSEAYVRRKNIAFAALDRENDVAVQKLPGEKTYFFILSSGAGAWQTELYLTPDGHFTGHYEDRDAGGDENYPGGTVDICTFEGQFGKIKKLTDYSYSLEEMEIKILTDQEEWVENETLYRRSSPWGMEGTEHIFYTEQTPVTVAHDGSGESWWYGISGESLPETGSLGCCAMRVNDPQTMVFWFFEDPYSESESIDIDAVHFPDNNFRSYVLANLDTDKDGILSRSEADNVTAMDVADRSISSLKGLEYFTGLTELNCSCNLLTSLDVSMLTNLTRLYCDWNQLTALDVSMLTNLTELNCQENMLTALDVSKLTNLKELGCGVNDLTTLDVSNLTNLTRLYCHANSLTSLDVSKLTNLEELCCESTFISSLDLSKLTRLTMLMCEDTQLTSLDVSMLTGLTVLHCNTNQLTSLDVSMLTSLVELWCQENQLTSLDVSNLSNLKSLSCYSNQLTTLDVSQLSNLENLWCSANQLTSLDVSMLTHLAYVSCDANKYTVYAPEGWFDLSTLPGFDVSRASNWNGGTVNGTILTVSKDSDVTYSYDMGQNYSEIFTLAVIKKEPGAFSLPSGLSRIEDEAFRGSGVSCFYLDSNVSHIGAYAFADLLKAAVIHMPAGDISIDDTAFSGSAVTLVCTADSPAAEWAEAHGIPVTIE